MWTGVKCNFSWEHFQKRYIVRKLSLSRVQMGNFTRIGPKTKKLWLSIVPALRRSYQPRLGQPQKGVNCNFSWPHLDKSCVVRKLSTSEAWICSFSMIVQKIKNYSSFNFFAWKLRKISLDWALWCASTGSTIFLYRSSTSRTSLVSSRLAELKYAFFSRTGRNNKKWQCSNLFQLTMFNHGLLEGSTILLQYNSI